MSEQLTDTSPTRGADLSTDVRSVAIAAARERFFAGLLSLPDFARVIDRCDKTVRNLIHRGLPHVKLGGAHYIRVEEAREWLLARGAPPDRESRGRGRPRKATTR